MLVIGPALISLRWENEEQNFSGFDAIKRELSVMVYSETRARLDQAGVVSSSLADWS